MMITDMVSTSTNQQLPNYSDVRYRASDIPCDTNHPCSELVRVVNQGWITPCRAIELGCGNGSDAVFLTTCGFHVAAVDASFEAIQQAVARADRVRVRVNFRWADVLNWPNDLNTPFDFVFDRGCYHCVRKLDIEGYVATLARITRPGTLFLLLAGSAKLGPNKSLSMEENSGSPSVREEDIYHELGSLFQYNWIRPFRFDSPDKHPGPSGWSCLMTRV